MSILTALAGYLSIDVVTLLVTAVAGERIGSYVALAWRWYKRIKAAKAILSGEQRKALERLSRLEAALEAGELVPVERSRISDDEHTVLTDEKATLKK